MPTYKNNTSGRISVAGRVTEPGQSFSTHVWLDEAATGLTKTADSPMDNPIYYSAKHSSDATVAIPDVDVNGDRISKFRIKISVVSGEVSVYFSSVSNTPALLLYPGSEWIGDCWERTVDSVVLDFTSSGSLWLTVQRL